MTEQNNFNESGHEEGREIDQGCNGYEDDHDGGFQRWTVMDFLWIAKSTIIATTTEETVMTISENIALDMLMIEEVAALMV